MYFFEPTRSNLLLVCATVVASYVLVSRELKPDTRLGYSKFADNNKKKKTSTVPSRIGMLIIYTPASMLSLAALYHFYYVTATPPSHVLLIAIINFIHYAKRIFEVLYVHRYSGVAIIGDAMAISVCYATFTAALLYFTASVPDTKVSHPEVKIGILLFILGESINHYHHRILSDLRKDGSKEYKIPYRGLFRHVWCPHYLGEILSFVGMALVSQNLLTVVFQLESAAYLCVRAYNTRQWYMARFPKVPKKVCLIPGLY